MPDDVISKIYAERYSGFLPEIFREALSPGQISSVEKLLGIVGGLFGRFEEKANAISEYFDPYNTVEEFLPWLASWVSLVLRADWGEDQRRKVLAQIIRLYRMRGTKDGLTEYLKIYVGDGVTIDDLSDKPLPADITSGGGTEAIMDGGRPYFFIVNIKFGISDIGNLAARAASVKAVLEIEKPAHTSYELRASGPTFRVGVQSRVGVDSII